MLDGATGARCLAIEPIPSTFAWLRRNIAINGLGERVQALNVGLGRGEGRLRFTGGLDTVNHVLADGEATDQTQDVQVRSLDGVLGGQSPTLIKIDVEGFESEVLHGAERTLADPALLAVIMECNGSGRRYGFDENGLHRGLLARGFVTYDYRPFERLLRPLHGTRAMGGNTLYVRDCERLAERVREAARFRLGTGRAI